MSLRSYETPEDCVVALFDPLLDAAFAKDHFLPKEVNRKLLGVYGIDDLIRIHKDLLQLQESLFAGADKGVRQYVATAGSPGSGKSTVLEAFMAQSQTHFVYADPDRATLLHMENTYKRDRALGLRTPEEAYNYWRDASNFLANYFLAKALQEGYAVTHGTTMTAPAMVIERIFTTLKNVYGYSVHLLDINCDNLVREQSEQQRRAHGVVQCTCEDFYNKGKAFCQRFPSYLGADRIDFYYRDRIDHASCVATREGTNLIAHDKVGFIAIQKLHDDSAPGAFTLSLHVPIPT